VWPIKSRALAIQQVLTALEIHPTGIVGDSGGGAVGRQDSKQFLTMPIVAVRIVVAIARSRIPLLVAMFVGAMFVGAISIMASITAIAACKCYGSHHD
jgi:hypothetical protein